MEIHKEIQYLKWALQSPETKYSFTYFPVSKYSIEDFAFLEDITASVNFEFNRGLLFDEEVFYVCTEPKKIPKASSKKTAPTKPECKPTIKKVKPKKARPKPAPPNYIYLISNGTHQKIGITNDPQRRLRGLQTASPIKLTCLAAYQASEYTFHMERRLHMKFKDNRLEGEWFSTKLTGDEFIELCKEDHETLKSDYPLCTE